MRRELHLASSPVTSARTRAAYSSGVANHCSDPALATNPRPDASSRFDRTLTSAFANPSASFEGKSRPFSPLVTRSSIPPPRAPTTARPAAERLDDDAAHALAPRREHEARGGVELVGDLLGREAGLPGDVRAALDERAREVFARACADQPKRCVRYLLRDVRPRFHEQVDPLVELERADEQRDRALGQRSGRNEERLQVHEGGERRRRLDSELANHSGREVRDRPHLVDVPHRPGRDAVGERVEETARPRAVQPRRGAPVAVDVEDHLRAAAREAPRDHRRRRVVRALDEHGVRLELA